MIDESRVRILRDGKHTKGPVVYVMGRDFRMEDNWALLYAQEKALERKVPLCVLVHLGKNHIMSPKRQHHFFIDGLQETAAEIEQHNIPFFVTVGDWKKEVKQFIDIHNVGLLVTDFSPLYEARWWWDEVSHGVSIPIHEVDAHNIVPCWLASEKEEYTATAFRNKLTPKLKTFLTHFPKVIKHPYAWGHSETACWPRGCDSKGCVIIDWDGLKQFCKKGSPDADVVAWCKPGTIAAQRTLATFITQKLDGYARNRNNPTLNALSELSPYIHFGFIAPQRVALSVSKAPGHKEDKDAFLEEMIVRREIAENYCFYNDNYSSIDGLYPWAQKTLREHAEDERKYVYTKGQFEKAETHSTLWNAAQRELLTRGKIHGYMRMYWVKKILEWSASPEEAIAIGIYLNDTYALDGRDPNGYVGVLWGIGGLHDRAWARRPVLGTIRYMNELGCRRKFDVDAYIEQQGTSKLI